MFVHNKKKLPEQLLQVGSVDNKALSLCVILRRKKISITIRRASDSRENFLKISSAVM
jgi:hypothetical protein